MAIELVTCAAPFFLFICFYIRSCGDHHFSFPPCSFICYDFPQECITSIFRVSELVQVDAEEMGWKKMCQLYTILSLKRKIVRSSESKEQNKMHGVKTQNTHHHLKNNQHKNTENMETYTFSLVFNILSGEGSFLPIIKYYS
jgi:hypothetical protein